MKENTIKIFADGCKKNSHQKGVIKRKQNGNSKNNN